MKNIIILMIAALFFALPAAGEESWLTEDVLFYRIHYTDQDEGSIKELSRHLEEVDGVMRQLLNTGNNIDFGQSQGNIYLYPADSGEIGPDTTQAQTSVGRKNGKAVYTGEIRIQGPAAYADTRDFYRQLTAELSAIYLALCCFSEGIDLYDLEKWFVQGLKYYCGIFYSTDYWKESGYRRYLGRLNHHPEGIKTDGDITVENPYSDGFLMIKMLSDCYGMDSVIELMLAGPVPFQEKIPGVLDVSFKKFLRELEKWKKKTAEEAAS